MPYPCRLKKSYNLRDFSSKSSMSALFRTKRLLPTEGSNT